MNFWLLYNHPNLYVGHLDGTEIRTDGQMDDPITCTTTRCTQRTFSLFQAMGITVYANYFYDTSVIFSNSFITYREPFRI